MKRLLFFLFLPSLAFGTTYYASPSGSGSTCSTGSPGTAVACLAILSADDTLILKNGTYQGDNFMLHPTAGLSGTAGHPITVSAETDGGVLIDGQGAREPVLWNNNDYWVVQGFNAANSVDDVMCIFPGSSNNIFKRICAWNANPNANSHVWSLWQAPGNLLEDTCAFGTGRKMYETYELSSGTIRRPWAEWNRQDHDFGPYITYSLSYNSDHVIMDNPIGTRDEDADATCLPSTPPDGCGKSDEGIFSMDRLSEYSDCEVGSGYYGGIAYILGSQNIVYTDNHAAELHGGPVFGSTAFRDIALYMTPGTHLGLQRVLMSGYTVNGDGFGDNGCVSTTLTANRPLVNITVIGDGDGSHPDSIDTSSPNNGWAQSNYQDYASTSAAYTGGNTLFVNDGSHGATVCKQYQHGVLTSTPLWPWPMNQRIIDAMTAAGRTPVDVTATIQSIFGTIPSACRSDSVLVTPVITQTTPVVNQGKTLQFTETLSEPGTWTCSGTNSTGGVTACSGSINSATGLYTAPSSVTAQHVYGGMQVGPNNDVYNTRIDSMPVHSSNTLYMNTVNTGGTPNWNLDFPVNYVSAAGATDTMNFLYTPANNGLFSIPSFPNAKAENGWFSALQGRSGDHHVVMVDTGAANFSEFYQLYPNCVTTAASVTGNTATLTCSANPQTNQFMVGSTITVGQFSGSDTYFNVTSASVTAITSTSISYHLSHANASASTNGSASKSQADTSGKLNSASGIRYSSMTYVLPNLSTDAAGMQLQPMILGLQELEHAVITNGAINHAMRNTFGIGFLASSSTWPATSFATDGSTVPFGVRLRLKAGYNTSGFSSPAQVLLKQLKQYGTFVVDGGNNWPMNAEATRWPKVYYDALTEVANAVIVSSMEFVNESSIMVSTASSLTTNNREIVKFTRTSDSSTTIVDVALQGPAVNFAKDAVYIMAGTPAQQLTVLNNYGGYTCAMSPSTGTLTSGCLYTPPATLTVATTTIVTATSIINSSASAIMTLTVFPSSGIYAIPSKTSNYTDTNGNTWVARTGISNYSDTQGCCSCDNSASFSAVTDVSLWNCAINNTFQGADLHMDFLVPNGAYQVVYHYGTLGALGQQFNKYSIGSTEIFPNFDPSAAAGGQFKLFTSTNTVVSNNQLQVGIWTMNDVGSAISSLSIIPSTATFTNTIETIRGKARFSGAGRFR